jgi:hypothetical protein
MVLPTSSLPGRDQPSTAATYKTFELLPNRHASPANFVNNCEFCEQKKPRGEPSTGYFERFQ